jgi:hypothetical protein
MDGGGAPKTGLKITFLVLCVCVLGCLICYFYSNWAAAQAEQKEIPKLAIDEMLKSVRQYQKQTGQFPDDFAEVESKVWRHNAAADFGADKRRLLARNYYYIYSKVNPLTCAIWAIPSGPKRETATTVFVVAGVDAFRAWRGPSLSKADIEKLPLIPTNDQLNVMGMIEQPQAPKQGAGGTSAIISAR